jgi:hypothetical protein
MTVSRSKLRKISTILKRAAQHTGTLKMGVNRAYNDIMVADSPIPSVQALEFLGEHLPVMLNNFMSVDGNVSLDELVFICALAQKTDPKRIVEIGTFDGNTALQLALNTSPDSLIYTLDLPVGADGPAEVDIHDVKYIGSDRRIRRRFLGTIVEHKVKQCYGNSLTYDFSVFSAEGNPDFIFIDAGHSYECVRNDSEKSLKILKAGGVVVWQDYGTFWPGVYEYLVELSSRLPLVHIAGTSLVVYKS